MGRLLIEAVSEPQGVALRLASVSKAFGATQALRDVSVTVRPGEVHGLVGGNGSGKSTLIKILAGVLMPDAGTITIGGTTLTGLPGARPEDAREAGLRVVHQKSSVFPDLSVTENLALGSEFERGMLGGINWRSQRRKAAKVLGRFGIQADPQALISQLRPATRSMVAIARALQDLDADSPGVLVLDEPTASLPPSEVQLVLESMCQYSQMGHAVVFVSHRLDEVLTSTERVTVLKDGVKVAERATADLDHASLAALITGRTLSHDVGAPQRAAVSDRVGLEVRGLAGGALRQASLEVASGEIVGIAGLLGSGRSSLLRLLFGATVRTAGTVKLRGTPLVPASPAEAMRAGVAYVPEDRTTESVFPELSVAENLSFAAQGLYWSRGVLHRRAERRDSDALIDDFGIKCESPDSAMSDLSGGNQQKAILARWMRREPTLLLLDEPTHGVDVGSRHDIYALIRRAAAGGACVLVVSSDAEELEILCDRIVVMRDGHTVEAVPADAMTESDLEKIV